MSYLKNKPNSLEDMAKQMQIHTNESDYQDKFKKELDKAGKGIGSMTPKEKKDFFNKIDKMHTAKKENVNEEVNWTEAAEEQEKRSDEAKYYKAEEKSEIPAIDKDNKPGVKIAKIRAMKSDDKEKKESEIDKLKDQNALLKQKLEN